MSKQTPIISMLTKYLGVRRNKMWLRYKEDMSPRTIPKPNLPPGSNSKLSGNYYYTRDARREMAPPVVLAENTSARLAPGVRCTSLIYLSAVSLLQLVIPRIVSLSVSGSCTNSYVLATNVLFTKAVLQCITFIHVLVNTKVNSYYSTIRSIVFICKSPTKIWISFETFDF
ncbi:uncharacterized protein LOC100176555 isoform X1 [Ciona intestinalis]